MEMSILTLSGETYRRAFADQPLPMISYGSEFPEACSREILRLYCSNVFVIVSKSLSLSTDSLERLATVLGSKIAGTQVGVERHTPIHQCVGMIASVRELGTVDCIVTLGGGSVTDAGKLVRFALANEAYEEEDIISLWAAQSHDPAHRARRDIKKPRLPLICVPTSLSGGEYGPIAGATETKTLAKRAFDTGVNPTLVIQDPELCKATPQSLWLSSGIRAVDHCVETV
ncbi:hypothetical protein PRZ48_012027 [Zasmidium cellare]|uniref:Alcohol dehydrogenase iron-type/glycerol dehydrogenase GldA domain-containing protein n=1 Tax=Zasmidium cellare TaxID=395010 RepID=A0ABR0E8N0_ZASCE|nr:hypothetical protein PRZ48_012027 [Zasmidium cellare]